jgi:phosphate starvation-inducible PhoH-like protein
MTGKKNQETGMHNLLRIAKSMNSFSSIEFGVRDIVRSGFVKEYIITRINLGLD